MRNKQASDVCYRYLSHQISYFGLGEQTKEIKETFSRPQGEWFLLKNNQFGRFTFNVGMFNSNQLKTDALARKSIIFESAFWSQVFDNS